MSSKSQQKLFLCNQCSFGTTSSTLLAQHMITHSGQGVDEDEEEVGDGVIDRQFRCWHSLCPYVGRSGHDLRVHLMCSHDLRVKTNACLETKEEEESQEGVVDSTCSLVEEEEKKDWKCSETNCPFVGKSWVALRSHGINGHKDRTGKEREATKRRRKHHMSYRRGHQRWTQLSRRQMELKRRGSKGSSGPLSPQQNTRDRPAGEHKCQFPKCGFRADTKDALREHIRFHKSQLNRPFPECQFSVHKSPTHMSSYTYICCSPECQFSASDKKTYVDHLWANHSKAANDISKDDYLLGKMIINGENSSDLYCCPVKNCYYTTGLDKTKGLNIHITKTHLKTKTDESPPAPTTAHSEEVFACTNCHQSLRSSTAHSKRSLNDRQID